MVGEAVLGELPHGVQWGWRRRDHVLPHSTWSAPKITVVRKSALGIPLVSPPYIPATSKEASSAGIPQLISLPPLLFHAPFWRSPRPIYHNLWSSGVCRNSCSTLLISEGACSGGPGKMNEEGQGRTELPTPPFSPPRDGLEGEKQGERTKGSQSSSTAPLLPAFSWVPPRIREGSSNWLPKFSLMGARGQFARSHPLLCPPQH